MTNLQPHHRFINIIEARKAFYVNRKRKWISKTPCCKPTGIEMWAVRNLYKLNYTWRIS